LLAFSRRGGGTKGGANQGEQSSELRAQSVKQKRANKNKSANQADYVGPGPTTKPEKKKDATKKLRKPKRTKKWDNKF
jgi:hypothetical protein